MEPFFFGGAPARFGIFHPAEGRPAATGAVLCYPLGHEYLRSHRAFRNLAQSLSASGMPVLRFDYVGSGDSGGDAASVGLAEWDRDVDAAIEEVKRRAGVSRVSLIGLRFGATLAGRAGARRSDLDTLLLWDPVLSGAAYLDELHAVQASWLRDRLGDGAEGQLAGQLELIGMPISPGLLEEVRRVDLREAGPFNVRRLFLVASSARPDCEAWQQRLRAGGIDAVYRHVPSAGDWLSPDTVHQLLLPHGILKEIVALVRP